MSEVLHSYERNGLEFSLTKDCKLMVKNVKTGRTEERPWFVDQKGRPWPVVKRKSFKGLIAVSDRDGEYDDIRKG